MFLEKYYSESEGRLQITPQQASDFAKEVADDYNPIHDPDAQRFCVPGDLLFALILAKYGLSERMEVTFDSMVRENVPLIFPEQASETIAITNEAGKEFISARRSGEVIMAPHLIRSFITSYVEFSGHNFPHILVPLMAEHNVMINPDRPLVMYQGMSFDLQRFDFKNPKLELVGSTLEISKRRGNVQLKFRLTEAGEVIGSGVKTMVLSGLRPYEQDAMDGIVALYASRKEGDD